MGAPLEDARHLAQRYARMRQEAEAQVYAVSSVSYQFYTTVILYVTWLSYIFSVNFFCFLLKVFVHFETIMHWYSIIENAKS